MKNPIPVDPLHYFDNMQHINLDNFFGFCLAEIETLTNIKIPILPYRNDNGEIKYPIGNWTGVYFSEELKKVINFGYKIKPLQGWSFSKTLISDVNRYILLENAINNNISDKYIYNNIKDCLIIEVVLHINKIVILHYNNFKVLLINYDNFFNPKFIANFLDWEKTF